MKKLLLKIFFTAALFYAVAGFFILPYFVQFSIPSLLKKQYGIEIYIDSVHFNPFDFSFKLSNFILKDEKKENLVYFENLFINIDPTQLINGTVYIKKFALDNARIDIEFDVNKRSNFQFLLDTFATDSSDNSQNTTSKTGSPPFYIEQFDLSFFTFLFKDRSKAQVFDIETKPIVLSLRDISLDKNHINKIDFKLQTKKSGELHLTSDLVVNPLSAKGTLTLNNIFLDKFYYYVKPADLNLDIDAKILNITLGYDFQLQDDKTLLSLSNIQTNFPKTTLQVDGFEFVLQQYLLGVQSIGLQVDSTATQYIINGLHSGLSQLTVKDKEYKQTLNFLDLDTSVKQISSDKTKAIDLVQTLKTEPSGTLSLNALVVQEPLSATGSCKFSKIDLTQYKTYIEKFVNIDLHSALLDAESEFAYKQQSEENFIDLSSDIVLQKIVLENSTMKQPLIKINTIDFSKLHYKNNNLEISKVAIEKPNFEFYLNNNHTTNFTNLVKVSQEENKGIEKTPFNYTIGEVFIQNGEVKFFDNTLATPFQSYESDVNVYAKNITSQKGQYAKIEYKSMIDKHGLLTAKGSLLVGEPLKDLKVDVDVKNINLPTLSPYSGKFIGNQINNGELSLKFDHKIKDKKLILANNFRIKDIELGKKVESKDIIDAPIGLAIALLEDSEGYIDLDIPIKGDLRDQSFHIGDVILDMITNTIVGIVSAPFKFLGAIIGLASSDDLVQYNFNYGDAKIEVGTKEKLDKLAQVLEKRPGIDLKMKPTYLVDEDSKALIQKAFETQYSSLLDTTKELSERIDEVSIVFTALYSQEEFETIEFEDEQKLEFMLEKIKQTFKVTKNELELLAKQRVENIKAYLVEQKIDANRIQILEEFNTTNKEKRLQQVIVSFELGVNK
jgi:hypothetical protein